MLPRPPHPVPNVRDDRETPLCVGRDGGSSKDASTIEGSGIFFETGLDSMSADLPVGRKIRCCANLVCSGANRQFVISGRIEDANPESITTTGSMDSG